MPRPHRHPGCTAWCMCWHVPVASCFLQCLSASPVFARCQPFAVGIAIWCLLCRSVEALPRLPASRIACAATCLCRRLPVVLYCTTAAQLSEWLGGGGSLLLCFLTGASLRMFDQLGLCPCATTQGATCKEPCEDGRWWFGVAQVACLVGGCIRCWSSVRLTSDLCFWLLEFHQMKLANWPPVAAVQSCVQVCLQVCLCMCMCMRMHMRLCTLNCWVA